MENLLSLSGVSFAHPGGAEIIKNADLKVRPGDSIWLRGPSGSGKSTLLRLMNRLLSPGGGEISLAGRPLRDWQVTALRRQVALLPQTPGMIAGTVADNLLLPFTFKSSQGEPKPENGEMSALLDRLGLFGVSPETTAGSLSVGQRQRVALGRLLLMGPRVLLLDEPVSALDPDSRALVESRISRFASKENAVVMISHLEPPQKETWRRVSLASGRLEEE